MNIIFTQGLTHSLTHSLTHGFLLQHNIGERRWTKYFNKTLKILVFCLSIFRMTPRGPPLGEWLVWLPRKWTTRLSSRSSWMWASWLLNSSGTHEPGNWWMCHPHLQPTRRPGLHLHQLHQWRRTPAPPGTSSWLWAWGSSSSSVVLVGTYLTGSTSTSSCSQAGPDVLLLTLGLIYSASSKGGGGHRGYRALIRATTSLYPRGKRALIGATTSEYPTSSQKNQTSLDAIFIFLVVAWELNDERVAFLMFKVLMLHVIFASKSPKSLVK